MSVASLVRDVLADVEALKKKLEAIQVHIDANPQKREVLPKKPNGRLTEAGVRQLYSMIDAGYTDAAISRALEIRQSSVGPHRKRHLRESGSKRRR